MSDVDHVERMFAVVHSEIFPVASVVAVAMDDVLVGWRFQAEALELGAAVMRPGDPAFGTIRLAVDVKRLADAQARAAVQTQLAVSVQAVQQRDGQHRAGIGDVRSELFADRLQQTLRRDLRTSGRIDRARSDQRTRKSSPTAAITASARR